MIIATRTRWYALSPADPQSFLATYQRLTELGSLSPLPSYSAYPSFLVSRVWNTLPARIVLLTGIAASLLLIIWVSLAAPGRSTVVLGFGPDSPPVPGVRLLLLPVLNTLIFMADFFLGLFFFRQEGWARPGDLPGGLVLAYLLWGNGALSALAFLVAVGFILSASG